MLFLSCQLEDIMDSRIHLTNNTLSAWNTSFEIISLLKQDYINELTTITLQNVNGVSDLSFFANVKNIQDFVLTNTSIVDIRDIPMSTNIRILRLDYYLKNFMKIL